MQTQLEGKPDTESLARQRQPKPKPRVKGGTKSKPKATRKSSRSPENVRVKKEVVHEDESEQMLLDPVDEGIPRDVDVQIVREGIRDMRMDTKLLGRGAPGASGSRSSGGIPKPYPVVFDGPIPRSIHDVDTPERLHQRRYCGHLFHEKNFGKDEDGLQECFLLELPDLLPFDRDKVRKWKASEEQRIREGKPPVDYESDYEGMTDEEKKQVVECCTPADLEGMQVGTVRVYEDGFVEYVCGGVRFQITEGTDVIDREDIYFVNNNDKCVDSVGHDCEISMYPMMTVTRRLVCSPIIDDLI